jgi:RNA polymerase sigma factor (sigma-70 family)
MSTSRVSEVMQYLRRTAILPHGVALTDGQLLSRFVEGRDEDAFAALVRRHGPMVWGVCRRLLANHQDAEDAFQATFLVLVRKAATVLPREMVANWLYGVAHMTAQRGRATAAKARRRERQVAEMPEPAVAEPDLWDDLRPLLDQELARLPDSYRVVVVLCDLQGKTRKEAARQLGLPEGTVASRLARTRAMLAKRLARHGLAVSGGTLAAVLSQKAASAGVPRSVVYSTIKAASLVAGGQAAATGLISAKVVALSEGVIKTMLLTKLKIAMAIALGLAVTVVGVGVAGLRFDQLAQGAPDNEIATSAKGPSLPGDHDSAAHKKAVTVDAPEKPQASEDEKQKALADFSMLYALKPAEVLKRVATPFPPSRFVYHRQHYPKDDKAQDMMFLRWDNGLHFSGTLGGIKSDPRKVQLVFLLRYLPSMIGAVDVLPGGRRELDVRGDQELLLKAVEGDFVARSEVPFEKIVARLQEILRDECKLPVRLTLEKDRGAYTLFVDRQKATAGDPATLTTSQGDFQALHKYFTDPRKKTTTGKEVADEDWNERRESTYSIRTIMRVIPPYNLRALNDDYQDVRVRKETKDFVELEVISYPLNTNADAITENSNWKHDYAGMKEYLKPGVTTNWDAAMQKDLLAELALSGIHPDQLSDKQVVEQVSRWLLRRCKYRSMAFGTMYADFRDGKPVIFPGLERAFEREKGDPAWTMEEEFAHELFGKGMFYNRCRGSCTSSAVLWATVLRALGIPTRIIVAIPIVDQNDPEQIALVKNNLRHHQVRATILNGLLRMSHGFANHTYTEVFVGNRWRRLNYAKLGQNILDEQYLGLMIHVHTFNDLSEAGFAPTWGRRYALGLRDPEFKTSNPYRTLELSDHFGRDSKVPNPPAEEHSFLTITKAYWRDSNDAPQVIREKARRPGAGEGHLYVHVKERLASQDTVQYLKFLKQTDRRFLLRAKDRPEIKGEVQFSVWSDSASGLREILLVIPKEEYAKMAPCIEYSIHPANSTAGYQWRITGGLTIRRGPSSDNTDDALHKGALQARLAEENRRLQEQKSKGVIIGRIAERAHGMPPMLLIASGIDAHSNLLLSGTEQRKKQLPREIEIQGKKTTLKVTVSYPVTVLDRQTVSLSDATICDLQGNKLSIDQARERLREPTPVLLTCVGEKLDPIYLKIMMKETLTFAFPRFPDFKELSNRSASRPPSGELKRQGIAVGARVPDFSVQTLDGKTVKLSDLQHDEKRTKKGVVVLTFWCSTCGSCRRVEHDLDKLAKDYAGQASVIALDSNSGEKAERIVAFAKEKGLGMPIVLDPSGRAADFFGAKVTTTTAVIDGNGVLRYYGRFKDGHLAYAEQALKAVLSGKEVEVKETPPDG